ncbi:DNA-binding protein [Desulfovibrio sp. OttesenSCG-928-C14]|nr:DNA-binding protein [Desulfovibrio sp. OttesenSCG-928-C14]
MEQAWPHNVSGLVSEILLLVREGWRPYHGTVTREVYRKLGCQYWSNSGSCRLSTCIRNHPYWFTRGEVFLCLGCPRKCGLHRPEGFQLPLPLKYGSAGAAKKEARLSPQELVARKPTLLVKEAAYCLSVSERLIYKYIADGRLAALKDRPMRVRSEEVAGLMSSFDE